MVYDGKYERDLSFYLSEDLQTGGLYKFKVSAYNFNGEGPLSDALETYACVAPAKMLAPWRVTSTTSTFTLEWKEPADNGGCIVTSYAVFRDDGMNGAIQTEVNTQEDTNIRDKPTLRQVTVTNLPGGLLGNTFYY
jgi:hypothetical protein